MFKNNMNKSFMDYTQEDEYLFCKNFLKDVYDIKNINDATKYIENNYDNLTHYTGERLLNTIYYVFSNSVDYPNDTIINLTIKIYKDLYTNEKNKQKVEQLCTYDNVKNILYSIKNINVESKTKYLIGDLLDNNFKNKL